ncbi:MAG: glycosyltransferase [Chloroflexi bacterium]|nr:glycosyltransferase [Chloroflexota bacterium]
MKKVLIIGFLHPLTLSGGSFRTLPLASYLPEFGWEPVVLTPLLLEKRQLPFRVVETPYRDVLVFWKKLFGFKLDEDIKMQVKNRFGTDSKTSVVDFFLTRAGEILNYPDSHRGWQRFALEAGNNLLEHEKIDAMISCHPTISHIIASNLKAKHRIPWLADFPDLWSQNHNYSYSSLRKAIDKRLEKKTLSMADVLTTVSEPWAEELRALHKGKPVYTVTHGFDPLQVNIPPVKLTDKFTITYTGTIYRGKQQPSRLFAALRDLISDETIDPVDVEVRFYGSKHDWLDKEIKQYGLSNIVKQYGVVPRQAAIIKQRESQLLLFLDWDDPQEKGVYTGKIYEYLGTRRPTLATGGAADDVVAELLNKTKAGKQAATVEDIKQTLKNLYREYKLKGDLAYNSIDSEINKHSHREMARKFSAILDRLAPQ